MAQSKGNMCGDRPSSAELMLTSIRVPEERNVKIGVDSRSSSNAVIGATFSH